MPLFDAIFTQSFERCAIQFDGDQITYAQLRRKTVDIAWLFQTQNVLPGDRVALLLNDSPEFIAGFIALLSSGAIAVPINLGLHVSEQRTILHDCGAKLALVEASHCQTLLTDDPCSLQALEKVVTVRGRADQTTGALDDLLPKTDNVQVQFPEPTPTTPAFILYTSGSTGEPKGAVHRESDMFFTNQTFGDEVLQLTPDDRVFSSSRLPFAYGLGNSLTFPLLNGATSILCPEKPTAEVIARIFATTRPTVFFGVPVIYSLLLDYHKRVERLDCSSLRRCISAGEALPAQLGEDWEATFGVELLDGIGSTEMLHMFMSNHAGEVVYGSSGKLLEGYEARLLDDDGGNVLDDTEGHLWIKGESAAMNYWQRPVETTRTFVDGWVRTGDLYRRDANGFWFHQGRSDDCFKSSGRWVSPVEVEGVVLRHPHVARAAVVEDFDQDGLPCPCAFVIANKVESAGPKLAEELQQLTAEHLPRYKRPRRYMFVKELPYTATGKIQRFKLREQLRRS